MADEEVFFPISEMLTDAFGVSAEQKRGKGRLVKKMPLLFAEASDPLQTILICRGSGERILLIKDFDRPRNATRPGTEGHE